MAGIKVGVSSLENRITAQEAIKLLIENREKVEVVIKTDNSEFNFKEKAEKNFFTKIPDKRKKLRLIPRD